MFVLPTGRPFESMSRSRKCDWQGTNMTKYRQILAGNAGPQMLFRGDWSRAQEIIKQKVIPVYFLLHTKRAKLPGIFDGDGRYIGR